MDGRQTVLIVDDEAKIAALLKSYLEAAGYGALCAANGKEALSLLDRHGGGEDPRISLILLDLMLPDISGEDFCKTVRRSSDVPIIMVTAKVDEESIIGGLAIGADDYVCKPFSPRQVVARVAAALRRSEGTDPSAKPDGREAEPNSARGTLPPACLKVDTENRIVSLDGKPVPVTRDEYNILTLLMSRRAKIFTRDEILDAVKGDDFYGFDRSVDSHIKRLRAKLGDDPKSPRYISTVYGIGYRFGGA